MIFNVPGHIDMIRNGLHHVVLRQHDPKLIIKTQTRRLNRSIYKVDKDYAVQRKRGVKAEPDIRIVMDRIWKEYPPITLMNANAEGGYTSRSYEWAFKKAYPKWDSQGRYCFEFHVIEVQK